MGARIMGLFIVLTSLRRITLTNLLSFGPEPVTLELGNLNILIGPNGSGKSNFIEAISLLRATPVSGPASKNDLRGVMERGGGMAEWIWKGASEEPASIEGVVSNGGSDGALVHLLSFQVEAKKLLYVVEESIHSEIGGERLLVYVRPSEFATESARLAFLHSDSILAEKRDADRYPEFGQLADFYQSIRTYREWVLGHNSRLRERQWTDDRSDRLEEDYSNLGPTLSRLRRTPKTKAAILDALKDLYEGLDDFEETTQVGFVEVIFTEGEFSIPASRISDGALRYLCLLAILCDPDPPPLICIEEPELGLHPDILPNLARLLVEASQRTQLIVTTHSDVLVDAMTEQPEAVVICEKRVGRTTLKRLNKEELTNWLKNYRLGELWSRGFIGGNRW